MRLFFLNSFFCPPALRAQGPHRTQAGEVSAVYLTPGGCKRLSKPKSFVPPPKHFSRRGSHAVASSRISSLPQCFRHCASPCRPTYLILSSRARRSSLDAARAGFPASDAFLPSPSLRRFSGAATNCFRAGRAAVGRKAPKPIFQEGSLPRELLIAHSGIFPHNSKLN